MTINNSTNINKSNNHLSPQLIEQKKRDCDIEHWKSMFWLVLGTKINCWILLSTRHYCIVISISGMSEAYPDFLTMGPVIWYFEPLNNQPRVKYSILYLDPEFNIKYGILTSGSNLHHSILNPITVNWTLSFLPIELVHYSIWRGSIYHR